MEALFIVHSLFVIHVYRDQPTYWRDQEGKWSVDSILWVFPGGVFNRYYNMPPVQGSATKERTLDISKRGLNPGLVAAPGLP